MGKVVLSLLSFSCHQFGSVELLCFFVILLRVWGLF